MALNRVTCRHSFPLYPVSPSARGLSPLLFIFAGPAAAAPAIYIRHTLVMAEAQQHKACETRSPEAIWQANHNKVEYGGGPALLFGLLWVLNG